MWTGNKKSIIADPVPGIFVMTVTYTDGQNTQEITDRYSDPNEQTIKKIISDKINELNRIDAVNALIANPTLGPVDLTPPQPTQEQLDENAYNQQRQQLIQSKQDLDLGLIQQSDYDSLLQDTQTKLNTVKTIKKV